MREIVEQWLIYDLEKDCQHINVLLGILILTDSLDSTVSKVMTEIIDCKIEKRRDDLERFLYSIFAEIKKVFCVYFFYLIFINIVLNYNYTLFCYKMYSFCF